jgi:hypothetical protein
MFRALAVVVSYDHQLKHGVGQQHQNRSQVAWDNILKDLMDFPLNAALVLFRHWAMA